jgi:hypothetical protein
VRGALQFYRSLRGCNFGNSKAENTYAKRRLYLYLVLIQIRGWGLYLVFDKIEDLFVSSADYSECWYENLLHHNYSRCQGRVTDFSDHVVLYFAQILPIALVEVLHSFVVPFWDNNTKSTSTTTTSPSAGRTSGGYNHWVPVLLLVWLVNLYFVTFLGAYKTSVCFHTGPEILIGYLVSLCIQIPLCLLQCSSFFPWAREYFYGHAIP